MLVRWAVALLVLTTACGGSGPVPMTPAKPVFIRRAQSPCSSAYAEYEAEWRIARTEDLEEPMAGYEELVEEIIRTELLTTPSRAEVTELREIYAVIDAFLWNAPWPRALKAAETAIEQCGEQALRPTV